MDKYCIVKENRNASTNFYDSIAKIGNKEQMESMLSFYETGYEIIPLNAMLTRQDTLIDKVNALLPMCAINAEADMDGDLIRVSDVTGDWAHTHEYLKEIMEDAFGCEFHTMEYHEDEDNEDDFMTATHYYKLPQ